MAPAPPARPPMGGEYERGPTCARTKPSCRCWRSCSEACTSCGGAAGESLWCAWWCKPSAGESGAGEVGRKFRDPRPWRKSYDTGPRAGFPCYSKPQDERPVGANGIDAEEHFTHFPPRHSILLQAACRIWLPTEYSEQSFPSSFSLVLTPAPN